MPRPASPGCGLRSGHQIPFFLRSRLNLQQAHAATERGMGDGGRLKNAMKNNTKKQTSLISHLRPARRMPYRCLSTVLAQLSNRQSGTRYQIFLRLNPCRPPSRSTYLVYHVTHGGHDASLEGRKMGTRRDVSSASSSSVIIIITPPPVSAVPACRLSVLSCPAHSHTPPHPSSDHFSHSTESLKRDGLRKHLQQHRSTRCNALTQLTLS
ncbi:hypothetical protein K456DRAFT_861416 [Colletotrichum gloeosporioides 23]|nr:hypothetical protein K456DRAFT_861416 [Colletotrichum gloeosporioides 23]